MKLRMAMVAAIVASSTFLPALIGTSVAGAAPAGPQAEITKVQLINNRNDALVTANYRCSGGEFGEGTHLWVSVKQGGPDPSAPESGESTTSWYDDHPKVVCDGNWHHTSYTLDLHSDKTRAHGGQVWAQFCLFESDGDPIFVQEFRHAKVRS
jgi:hypothetical protein